MSFGDALIVSILGVGVVFCGLILTSLLIYSFSIPEKISNLKSKKLLKKKEASFISAENIGDLEPDILAVVATVLEIEYRLGFVLTESRFTFKTGI